MEEFPHCCYVCEHEKPEEHCELLKRSLKDIFKEANLVDYNNHMCPPIICPLRKTNMEASYKCSKCNCLYHTSELTKLNNVNGVLHCRAPGVNFEMCAYPVIKIEETK